MHVDRELFMGQGFLILRNVVPRDQLAQLRWHFETALEAQKLLWAKEAGPDDPPGGLSEKSGMPPWVSTDFRYSGRLSGDGSNAPDTRIAFTIAARESRSPQLTFELSISGTSKHDAFRRIALDHALDHAYIDLIQKLIARLEIQVEEEEFNYE